MATRKLLTPFSSYKPPKRVQDYLRSPLSTFKKTLGWLNASWQLRNCDRVGRWTRLSGKIFVANKGQIFIGERVQLHSHFAHSVLAVFEEGRLEIGDRTVLNYGVDIAATKLVKIGSDCLIGTHVIILDNDFHKVENHDEIPEARPINIANNVWIGNRAIVLPGVNIGEGAVVGSGSVVMTDIPPRCLALGNPARVIKQF